MVPSYDEALQWLGQVPSFCWSCVFFGFAAACFKFWERHKNGQPFLPLYMGLGVLPAIAVLGFAAAMTTKAAWDSLGIVLIPIVMGGMLFVLPFSIGFVLGGAFAKVVAPIMPADPKE